MRNDRLAQRAELIRHIKDNDEFMRILPPHAQRRYLEIRRDYEAEIAELF